MNWPWGSLGIRSTSLPYQHMLFMPCFYTKIYVSWGFPICHMSWTKAHMLSELMLSFNLCLLNNLPPGYLIPLPRMDSRLRLTLKWKMLSKCCFFNPLTLNDLDQPLGKNRTKTSLLLNSSSPLFVWIRPSGMASMLWSVYCRSARNYTAAPVCLALTCPVHMF